MVIENDPFKLVIKAFNELYPGKIAVIYFKDTDEWDAYGVTFFPKNERPIIYVDPDYSIRKATEVLIHELAHVAAGHEAAHGKIFEFHKNRIAEKYKELRKAT
jgi:hypothetical protein